LFPSGLVQKRKSLEAKTLRSRMRALFSERIEAF
jgi:hypothetical protein